MNWYVYVGGNPLVESDPSGYGLIACLRCFWCTAMILRARHECIRENPGWCETWETEDQMGDRVRRINQCIEQYTRPGYIAYCFEMCLRCIDVRTPRRPKFH